MKWAHNMQSSKILLIPSLELHSSDSTRVFAAIHESLKRKQLPYWTYFPKPFLPNSMDNGLKGMNSIADSQSLYWLESFDSIICMCVPCVHAQTYMCGSGKLRHWACFYLINLATNSAACVKDVQNCTKFQVLGNGLSKTCSNLHV